MHHKLEEQIQIDMPNPLLAEYLNAKYKSKYSIEREGCAAVEKIVFIDSDGLVRACRDCIKSVGDLKKDKLQDIFYRFSSFMRMKREYFCQKQCECIYSHMCNNCCLSKENKKESICYAVEKRYSIATLEQQRKFFLKKDICMYASESEDFYNVLYLDVQEKVEYELIGYQILQCVKEKALTSIEVADIIGLESSLIFRFLIQEYSKGHVDIEEV